MRIPVESLHGTLSLLFILAASGREIRITKHAPSNRRAMPTLSCVDFGGAAGGGQARLCIPRRGGGFQRWEGADDTWQSAFHGWVHANHALPSLLRVGLDRR